MKRGLVLLAVLLTTACNVADRDRNGDERRSERVERDAERNDRSAPEQDNSAEESNAQAEGAELASATPRDTGGVNREWFAGAWTDTGDCADAGTFSRDGRYQLADGTRGMWNVRDGRLVVENANGRNEVRLRRVGDDRLEIVNQDGSVGRSIRCGGNGKTQ